MSWLRLHGSADVILGCHATGPLISKSQKIGIAFEEIPLFPSTPLSFFRSWRALSSLLAKAIAHDDNLENVWVFEGREHTLAALHRIFHRDLWRNVKLIRVRGQANTTRNTRINQWLYARGTDAVIFVADVVRQRSPFELPQNHSITFPYCADFSTGVRPWEKRKSESENSKPGQNYHWVHSAPDVDFNSTLLLVVGRYDPIKGHKELINAFSDMDNLGKIVQLVFIGCSENIMAAELVAHAWEKLGGEKISTPKRSFVSSRCGQKRLYICDERFSDVSLFMVRAHWGVIPSLGSEVICRVAVEFLQNGTPCIATDVGALREVLEGGPSRIVPLHNHLKWIQALESASALASDPAFFALLRPQCKRFGMERYSWERYSELMAWLKQKR